MQAGSPACTRDAVFQRSSENVQDAGRANVYMDKDRPATFSGFVIRGKRIATAAPELVVRVSSDAVQIEPMVVASVIAVPLLIITFSLTIIGGSIRQKHKKKKKGLADNFDAKAGEDSGTQ